MYPATGQAGCVYTGIAGGATVIPTPTATAARETGGASMPTNSKLRRGTNKYLVFMPVIRIAGPQ
jgi:hypothetical protein